MHLPVATLCTLTDLTAPFESDESDALEEIDKVSTFLILYAYFVESSVIRMGVPLDRKTCISISIS